MVVRESESYFIKNFGLFVFHDSKKREKKKKKTFPRKICIELKKGDSKTNQ